MSKREVDNARRAVEAARQALIADYNAATDAADELDAEYERKRVEARRRRVEAILAMRDAGMRWADIADATGLTRQRLDQLIKSLPR